MHFYTNGQYSVWIELDGTIHVEEGDWLSKYSAAIHDDFYHIYEYGRPDASGLVSRIENPDVVFAGETIYHLPTLARSRQEPRRPPGGARQKENPSPPPPVSKKKRKKITRDFLKHEFNLRGQRLKAVSEIAGYISDAGTLVEIVGLFAETGAVGTSFSVFGVVYIPFQGVLSTVNAWESTNMMYGMRAVAYATTAWAFSEPIPSSSPTILERVRAMQDEVYIREMERAWAEAAEAAVENLEKMADEREIQQESLRKLLRAWGEDAPQTLCRKMLEQFESELNYRQLPGWKANYSVLYPR